MIGKMLGQPQNPDETWAGIGRSPKWVQVILAERGIDMAAFKGIPMYQIHAYCRARTSLPRPTRYGRRPRGLESNVLEYYASGLARVPRKAR